MKRNKRLLLKAAKRIEEIPESYDQRTFAERSKDAPCGTVCCLAGEIIIASERSAVKGVAKLNEVIRRGRDGDKWPGDVAADLAGLNHNEAVRLFANTRGQTWPARFVRRTKEGRARCAPKLLRYVAAGGKV